MKVNQASPKSPLASWGTRQLLLKRLVKRLETLISLICRENALCSLIISTNSLKHLCRTIQWSSSLRSSCQRGTDYPGSLYWTQTSKVSSSQDQRLRSNASVNQWNHLLSGHRLGHSIRVVCDKSRNKIIREDLMMRKQQKCLGRKFRPATLTVKIRSNSTPTWII